MARNGAKEFYEGETARILASQMEKNAGLITLEDLREYQAVERKPLEGDYKGYRIITSPPPSSGGVGILQMLAMLAGTSYEKSKAGSATAYQSEEHTSELQSRLHLVCRLLLEKKKKTKTSSIDI